MWANELIVSYKDVAAVMCKIFWCIPVAHKEIAYAGKEQQDDCGAQLERLVFIFVGKSDKDVTY